MSLIITGVDIESTGLNQSTGARIIEIALLSYDFATQKLVDSYVTRIDPQAPIEAGAQEIHGIAYSDLIGCPVWEDVANDVESRMNKSDLLIAHNMAFDGPFIAGELARIGKHVPKTESLCTMENGRWATYDGKLPKLSELCFALGVSYDAAAAHAADYDVNVMMDCFFKALKRGFYQLPASFAAKLAA